MKIIQGSKYPLGRKRGNEIDKEHTESIPSIDNALFLKLGGRFMNVHYSTSNCPVLHKIDSSRIYYKKYVLFHNI